MPEVPQSDVVPRSLGTVGSVAGVAGLAWFPRVKERAAAGSYEAYLSAVPEAWVATLVGGLLFTWGAFALWTGRWRPLTPERALVAPVAVSVPWAVAAYVPSPQPDRLGEPWTAPAMLPDVVAETLVPTGGGFVGAAALAAVGVALARDDRLWAARAAALPFSLAVVAGLVANDFLYGFGGLLFGTAVGGVLAGPFGYLAALRRDEPADAAE